MEETKEAQEQNATLTDLTENFRLYRKRKQK